MTVDLAWDARPVARSMSVASGGVVVAAALAGLVPAVRSQSVGVVVLVIAGLLGLPHGAIDHLALGWARGRTGPAELGVLLGYAGAAVAAVVVALAAPLPALAVLLVLSSAHFAEGEIAFDRLRGGAGPVLPAAAMGVCVVVGPLLLRPAAVRPILTSLDPRLPQALAGVRVPLLAATALLVVLALGMAVRSTDRRPAGELALVVAAVLAGPPLLAFAAWFAGWHAPRHLIRLAALEPTGQGRERALRLARGAAVPTAVAAAGLAGLALVFGALPGALLVVLLALTVPHAAVVARLDRLTAPGRMLHAR